MVPRHDEEAPSALTIFYCYARKDKALRDEIDGHLAGLHRSGLVTSWHDAMIKPGADWEHEINIHLNTASIILLLVSSDFLKSDYCYGREMVQAIGRHKRGEAHVIPILLRPVDWTGTPFSALQMLPTNARPVTQWADRDAAFADIALGIRSVVNGIIAQQRLQEGQKQRASSISSSSTHTSVRDERAIAGKTSAQTGHISRRALLVTGIGTTSVALASLWFIAQQRSSLASSPQSKNPVSSPQPKNPTPSPQPMNQVLKTPLLTYDKHTAALSSMSWSPDGKYIASACVNGEVHVWNATSGIPLFTYKAQNSIWSVAWSPDNKRLAAGGADALVRIWDITQSTDPLFSYTGHKNEVDGVVWSPDGNTILSGGADKTLQIWKPEDRTTISTFHGSFSASITSVAWSFDGARVAGGSRDKTVQIWDATTAESVLQTYKEHKAAVNSLASSYNSMYLASGSDDRTVRVWNPVDAETLFVYQGHTDVVNPVAWAPNSQYILSGSWDKTAHIWDASHGSLVAICQGHTDHVDGVAWSHDSKRVATGGKDKLVHVWKIF